MISQKTNILRVDLDNTLCRTIGIDYQGAVPIFSRIDKINEASKDHFIVISSGRHWSNLGLTLEQLESWGVNYDSVILGQPPADIIDDRALLFKDFFKLH